MHPRVFFCVLIVCNLGVLRQDQLRMMEKVAARLEETVAGLTALLKLSPQVNRSTVQMEQQRTTENSG